MRTTFGFALITAFVGLQLAACSSGGSSSASTGGGGGGGGGGSNADGGTSEPTTSPFKAACEAYAKALCAREVACGPGTSISNDDEGRFRAPAFAGEGAKVCEDALAATCLSDHALPGIAETPQDVEACAQQTTTTCTSPTPRCAKKGTLADNAACNRATQCLSGVCAFAYSASSGFADCGKCARAAYGDVATNYTECQGIGSDLYFYKSGGKCDRLKRENEPCLATNVCVEGLVCAGNECVKAPAENDACKSRECGLGLACNGSDACVKVVLVGQGATCSPSGPATCNSSTPQCGSGSGGFTCEKVVQYVGAGASCGGSTVCSWPLECDRATSQCATPGPRNVCK